MGKGIAVSDDLSIPNPGFRGNRAGRYGTGKSRAAQRMDPGTKRLLMIAGGLGAVLLALIGASALIGHRGSEIPVVAADPRPVRVKPDYPGGMKIDGAENDVFTAGSDTADAKLAPPPEAPDRTALRAAAAAPPPVIVPPPQPVAKPAPPAIAAARPPTVPPAPEAQHTETQHRMVQLAALTSEDAAHAEWQRMARLMPDLFTGRQPNFSRTEHDGHMFWRIRTGSFPDVAQARAFCDRVRAKGGSCSVADF